MIVLLIYPFVLSMLYFRYGLTLESREYIRPVRLKIDEESLKLIYVREKYANSDNEESPEYIEERRRTIFWSEINKVVVSKRKLIIRFRAPKYSSITVPEHAWKEMNDKLRTIDILLENGIKFA